MYNLEFLGMEGLLYRYFQASVYTLWRLTLVGSRTEDVGVWATNVARMSVFLLL